VALASATPYLHMFGLTAGSAWLLKGAIADRGNGNVPVARFSCEHLLPETAGLKQRVITGGDAVLKAAIW